jgi:hypothetical protein
MSSLVIAGDVSGTVTIQAPSAAGTTILTLPSASGTFVTTSGTPTAGAVAYGTGTTTAFSAVGTSGQVLTSAGSGTPTWTTITVPPSAAQGFVTQYQGAPAAPTARSFSIALI